MTERARSFWGWGYADRFPDAEGLAALGEQAAGLLGLATPPAPRLPPTLAAVQLPSPRVLPPPALEAFCSAAREDRVAHTYGRAYPDLVRGFAGDFEAAPDWVAFPRGEEEVLAVMEHCAAHRLALVPFGGGTSVVGGVEARRGPGHEAVVSLDLRRLSAVLEVDPVSRAARIQAGALGPQLEAQLAPHGLSLRHFPQSFEFSTLGGWLATRAGGHFATLYTHIDDLTESIRMLTPKGVWASRRLPGSGAGPAPDRLVLGSEGTLGVITEAWMRVQARPRFRSQASVLFREYRAAVDAVHAISQAGLFPSNCRLLDAREALLNGVAGDGQSVLLLAFESAEGPRGPWMERALALAFAHGGECPDGPRHRDEGEKARGPGAADSWRSAFLDAPYLQNAMVALGLVADTFETACTWDRFPSLHAAVSEAVGAVQAELGGGSLSCRFTHVYPDGPAPYFTFLAPARPGEELEVWGRLKRAASDALLAQGATITHHHAVGRTHRPWYDRERPEPFALALRAAKAALDPGGILNPGVLFDP
jgi:alkyldihydroxyacetonephosphate synthase